MSVLARQCLERSRLCKLAPPHRGMYWMRQRRGGCAQLSVVCGHEAWMRRCFPTC